ncbi:MAG: hypothetical protein ACR2NR_10240 [Solirubrobacteraceae bacterium]
MPRQESEDVHLRLLEEIDAEDLHRVIVANRELLSVLDALGG